MLEFILYNWCRMRKFITAVCVAYNDKTAKDYIVIDKINQI